MSEKQQGRPLSMEEIEAVTGGWVWRDADLTNEERTEFYRLLEVYKELQKKAYYDPAFQAAADKAYDDWDAYTTFIQKKYDFLEKHRG